MSIDEIIQHIDEDCMHSYRDDADYALVELQYIPKIVALIKAGQGMAEAGRYLQKQVDTHRVVYVKHYYDEYKEAVVLLAAWDAATKEEEV